MTFTASSSSCAITESPVVVALDYHERDKALAFVDKIDPRDCRLKVGKEMFTLFGAQLVRDLQQRGFDVFLDLKFHDIPNTTAGGRRSGRHRRLDGKRSCVWRGENDGRSARRAGAIR